MSITVIGEDGSRLGEMSFDVAKKMALDLKKNLVLVNATENMYRIIDPGKIKYDQRQKKKSQQAQRRTHKIKEIKIGLNTADYDIGIKVKKIKEFLEKGLKTKITLQLHGREQAFQDVGFKKIQAIVKEIIESGLAIIDKSPAAEGKSIVVFLIPPK